MADVQELEAFRLRLQGKKVSLLRLELQMISVRFDAALSGEANQCNVFEHVQPAVNAAVAGLNSTIMAYGQTGSGKTHTLFGGLNPPVHTRTAQQQPNSSPAAAQQI